MNITLLTFDTLDSTNTEALRQAKNGAREGLCVVAREQTAGRGRHGRTWVSEKDAGLYFSIVLRPTLETRLLPLLTLAAGIAVHDTIAAFDLKPDIKWVNDVLVEEKKIAGILAETTDTADGLAVIVGIGINLKKSNFPPEIVDTATSIEQNTSQSISREQLVQRLTEDLSTWLTKAKDPVELIEEWSRRSTYARGKRVTVATGSEVIFGVTDGLEPNGALRVIKEDNAVTIVQAGDVERLRAEYIELSERAL